MMGMICLWFNAMDNDLLHASIHSPSYKIEDRITLALSRALLYSDESDDERDYKSAAANTFDIFCVDGGSRSLLSAIVISL